MERPSRSLRKLPARLSNDRSKSRGRTQDTESKKPVSPKSPKPAKDKGKKSPPRRSRSRSAGRKKLVQKIVEKKELEANLNSKAPSPPRRPSVVSRIKESVENVRNSLSPEVEEVVRRSISRFEEVKAEVVQRITPRASSLSVTTRASTMRLRTSGSTAKENNITSIDNSQEERESRSDSEEKIMKNHVGVLKEQGKIWERPVAQIVFLSLLGAVLSLTTLVSRIICTKDDCRLLIPTLEKVLNYKLYFHPYVWPIYSGSWIVMFLTSHFYETRVKKKPSSVSVLGIIFFTILTGALWYCQYYYNGVKDLDPLPILAATIFHMLILIALAGSYSTLLGVNLDLFVTRVSAILTILLVSHVAAVEKSRTMQHPPVLLIGFTTILMSLDKLIFEPVPRRGQGGLSLLYSALKPFLFSLPIIYVSANKVNINMYVLGVAFVINLISWIFFRICLLLKTLSSSSYKDTIKNSAYGNYIGGPWRRIRHPDLLGELLYEWSFVVATYPCPLSWFLPPLSAASVFVQARHTDSYSHPGYIRAVKYSLIPPLY